MHRGFDDNISYKLVTFGKPIELYDLTKAVIEITDIFNEVKKTLDFPMWKASEYYDGDIDDTENLIADYITYFYNEGAKSARLVLSSEGEPHFSIIGDWNREDTGIIFEDDPGIQIFLADDTFENVYQTDELDGTWDYKY